MSLRSLRVLGPVALVTLTILALPACAPSQSHADKNTGATSSECALRSAMRKLWEDHITWTRLYIVSAAAALPDSTPTTQRLLQNQVDIGNAIKPYYGDAAGDQLAGLLREHILGAAALIAAAKNGNNERVESARKAWFANADEIATFLSTANPKNWEKDEMTSMMHEHLDLTLQEATDRLQGKYAQDASDYDKVHDSILKMADALSSGIIKQFPKKFV